MKPLREAVFTYEFWQEISGSAVFAAILVHFLESKHRINNDFPCSFVSQALEQWAIGGRFDVGAKHAVVVGQANAVEARVVGLAFGEVAHGAVGLGVLFLLVRWCARQVPARAHSVLPRGRAAEFGFGRLSGMASDHAGAT